MVNYCKNIVFGFYNEENVLLNWLNGEPLFNPRDVGKCLEMPERTVKDYISRMNDKQKVELTNSRIRDLGFRKLNNRGEFFLTESGLYKLIFSSRVPKAEEFSDWVLMRFYLQFGKLENIM